MNKISVTEFRRNTSAVLRRVCEGEFVDITYRGQVVAILGPWPRAADHQPEEQRDDDWEKIWAEMDEIAAEISKKWPAGVSAVDAVREQRRNLTPDEWVQPEGAGESH